MSKLIKTNDTNLSVELSQINVVKIGVLSFEIEDGYPWIDVYLFIKWRTERIFNRNRW